MLSRFTVSQTAAGQLTQAALGVSPFPSPLLSWDSEFWERRNCFQEPCPGQDLKVREQHDNSSQEQERIVRFGPAADHTRVWRLPPDVILLAWTKHLAWRTRYCILAAPSELDA
jgi:hypothetical protein